MKNVFLFSGLILALAISALPVSAQINSSPKIIQLSAPVEVNLQELADFEAAHPELLKKRFIEQEEDRDKDFKFTPKTIPAGTPTFTIKATEKEDHLKSLISSPAPIKSWVAIPDNGTLIPPDIQGAAGVSWVMETTNQQFTIYSKTGSLMANVTITTMFAPTGGSGFFDPHILYDPIHSRWLVCIDGNVSNGDGGLFLAVSKTNNPLQGWYVYSIDDGDASTNDLLDYPEMGFNNNWVVLTANYFVGNNTTGEIYVFNRDSVYSGAQGTVKNFTDGNAFTWVPAQTYDSTEATEYLAQDANGNQGGSGYMAIGTITGTPNNPAYSAGSEIGVTQPWSENAVNATQLGNTNALEDGDTRVMNGVVYINGHLWFTHNVFLPANGPDHCGVDWWQIDPAALTVTQFGRIEDPTGQTFYYYPALNVNSNNDALLGYCVSSPTEYSSAAYSIHLSTDASSTMENPYTYRAGLAGYYKTLGGTRNRWGDFTGSAVDPVDNSFWNFGQFAGTGSNWGTTIAHVGDSAGHCSVTADFENSIAVNCSAPFTVNFTNLSNGGNYTWYFGDNDTSQQINPAHTYNTPGTYSVKLVAKDSLCGVDSIIKSQDVIIANDAPIAANVNICAGQSATLTATSPGAMSWYINDTTSATLATGGTYTTPALNASTTYYVGAQMNSPIDSCGVVSDNVGAGSYYTTTTSRGLIFSCTKAQTLLSVNVDASGTGNRVIQLLDAGNNVLQSKTINPPNGVSTVALNFPLPVATGLQLVTDGTYNNLYRNTAGYTYPYYSNDSTVEITTSTAGNIRYYFFYNWKLQPAPCITSRTAVVVSVLSNTGGSFTYTGNGTTINFIPTVGAATYSWSFGDGNTSTSANPSHTYSSLGSYTVQLIESDGTCSDTITQTIDVTGIHDLNELESVALFPNPATDLLRVNVAAKQGGNNFQLIVHNILGETLISENINLSAGTNSFDLNVSQFATGVYLVSLQSGKSTITKRFVKSN